MTRKGTFWTIVSLAVLSIPLALWFGRPHTGPNEDSSLPGTILSDQQMQTVRGGKGPLIEYW
jgi:hypothetical protein